VHVLCDHMRWREELSAELFGELGVGRLPELCEISGKAGVTVRECVGRGWEGSHGSFVFEANVHEAPSARLGDLLEAHDETSASEIWGV
jgi:hypothetical protein